MPIISRLAQVRRMRTLGEAWHVIRANGRFSQSMETRREIEAFGLDAEASLTRIQRQLARDTFKFKPSRGVPIPKKGHNAIRPIVISPIESRIVQRAIHDVLLTVPEIQHYADTPLSFGGVRKRAPDSIAAVPAAIQAILDAIRDGARYAIRSDIKAFFTKIPKPAVTEVVANAVKEPKFIELFSAAISVELENIASLREHAQAFPIHEIGVAQGNSLSPLLGNVLLYDFDNELNAGHSRCVRYIDDFIILSSDRRSAHRAFRQGLSILRRHGLEVSSEKTHESSISDGFEFLGIELQNGAIRPSKEARKRLLDKVTNVMTQSMRAFRKSDHTNPIPIGQSLAGTLYDVAHVVEGWRKHYYFCNEKNVFKQLDHELDRLIRNYIGKYSDARRRTDPTTARYLLGIAPLSQSKADPFVWPKQPAASGGGRLPAP